MVSDHLHVNNVAAGGNQVGLQAVAAAHRGGGHVQGSRDMVSPGVCWQRCPMRERWQQRQRQSPCSSLLEVAPVHSGGIGLEGERGGRGGSALRRIGSPALAQQPEAQHAFQVCSHATERVEATQADILPGCQARDGN